MFENVAPEIVVFFGMLIVAVVGVLAKYAIDVAHKQIPILVEGAKLKLGSANWDTLLSIAEMAIRAAEQARLNELIEDTGKAAKAYAMDAAKKFLAAQGLEEIDVDAIADLIEGVFNAIKGDLKEQFPPKQLGFVHEDAVVVAESPAIEE